MRFSSSECILISKERNCNAHGIFELKKECSVTASAGDSSQRMASMAKVLCSSLVLMSTPIKLRSKCLQNCNEEGSEHATE
jgi:hypothetical protein